MNLVQLVQWITIGIVCGCLWLPLSWYDLITIPWPMAHRPRNHWKFSSRAPAAAAAAPLSPRGLGAATARHGAIAGRSMDPVERCWGIQNDLLGWGDGIHIFETNVDQRLRYMGMWSPKSRHIYIYVSYISIIYIIYDSYVIIYL